jgi:hypothetical protein
MRRNDDNEGRARRYSQALVSASLAAPHGAARNAHGEIARLRWRVQPAVLWLHTAGVRVRAEG